MLKIIRLLLLPFSWLYGLVVVLRNLFYDKGLFKSRGFDLPVIVVGNLEVGGSGKTPVIEYLIRLLKDRCRVAVLSRGYGRKTAGFIRTDSKEKSKVSAASIGDEPFQYLSKFSNITVAVDADRVAAIRRLEADHDAILLDDAFQHRRLIPGFSILVLDYNTLFRTRLLLPAGNYREPFSGRRRAGLLLVSKAPHDLSPAERQRIIKRLAPASGQPVCFSSLEYDELRSLDPANVPTDLSGETRVLLLTGIARPEPLVSQLKKVTPHVTHLKYPDHHSYTVKNIAKIAEVFEGIDSRDKIILTTEKDAARLRGEELKGMLVQLPVFYWPVRIKIHEPDRELFNGKILEYVKLGEARLN
ncbi:lipid-A-disaccharide kinase [Anseongella ginsenosidimutans]|uniref:Tetraacyldisaccharide 4'-kinase n=1 Tax=Anseongella ginsenosidimutans TaxID=496056 RepID=A0A4R3KPV2_9SPHI|nr:tetraacyldisaccharide 4'-kinase [Anseongella ginsenosidimutans]QEC52618.1 tetraacyldisaccharide 4'-kinase [Anseongella ginsenosidimutans]TCS86541.1 lipid-A-disaccharide kinase [Anseongella ginsenosidimutans]